MVSQVVHVNTLLSELESDHLLADLYAFATNYLCAL